MLVGFFKSLQEGDRVTCVEYRSDPSALLFSHDRTSEHLMLPCQAGMEIEAVEGVINALNEALALSGKMLVLDLVYDEDDNEIGERHWTSFEALRKWDKEQTPSAPIPEKFVFLFMSVST